MKKGLITIFFILSLSLASASVIISEFESNPFDNCRDCTEWIELYNSADYTINLTDWKLVNNDSDEYILNEKINPNNYLIIPVSKWLDNSDEAVYLYNSSGELVSETPIKNDSKNDNRCWQNSPNGWQFEICTKEKPNIFADVNNDCRINILDLILIRNNQGK